MNLQAGGYFGNIFFKNKACRNKKDLYLCSPDTGGAGDCWFNGIKELGLIKKL